MRALSHPRSRRRRAPTPSATGARRNGATLDEVARAAGVSRATVSRVVNGSPKVSPDVRRAVEAAPWTPRLRPEPGRAQPGHPAQRLDRRGHHRAGQPAVQRPVLPAPPARHQRGPCRRATCSSSCSCPGRRREAAPAERYLPPATSTASSSSASTATIPCPRSWPRPASRSSSAADRRAGVEASYVDVDNRGGARIGRPASHRPRPPAHRHDHRPAATWSPASTGSTGYRDALGRVRTGPRSDASMADRRLHPGRRRGGDGAAARAPPGHRRCLRRVRPRWPPAPWRPPPPAGACPEDVAVVGFDDSPVAATNRAAPHQCPTADRGDGPRAGPPARRDPRESRIRATVASCSPRSWSDGRSSAGAHAPIEPEPTAPGSAPGPLRTRNLEDHHDRQEENVNRRRDRDRGDPRDGSHARGQRLRPGCSTAPSAGPRSAAARPGRRHAGAEPDVAVHHAGADPGDPGPNGGTVVRWFIGLGAGTQPAQIDPEQSLRRRRTTSRRSDVYLPLEIVDNTPGRRHPQDRDRRRRRARTSSGRSASRASTCSRDQLLDLSPLIAVDGLHPDRRRPSRWSTSSTRSARTVPPSACPFAVYPSFIFYNKDLFDEADLPYAADQGRRPVRGQAVGSGRAARRSR